MNAEINITRIDLGIIDGLHTWQVLNADTGEVIGYDQQMIEESE